MPATRGGQAAPSSSAGMFHGVTFPDDFRCPGCRRPHSGHTWICDCSRFGGSIHTCGEKQSAGLLLLRTEGEPGVRGTRRCRSARRIARGAGGAAVVVVLVVGAAEFHAGAASAAASPAAGQELMIATQFSQRVRPEDISPFARAPVRCVPSWSVFFGAIEVRDRVATLHGRCPLPSGKAPIFMPLPGLMQRFATAPDFTCPCCGVAGGGLFVPENGTANDLLHSCVAPYSPEGCACGTYRRVRFLDCIFDAPPPMRRVLFTVRGESDRTAGDKSSHLAAAASTRFACNQAAEE